MAARAAEKMYADRKVRDSKFAIGDQISILELGDTVLGVKLKKFLELLPEYPRVAWKRMMYKNAARPKVVFTMWLQHQGKLLTTGRLEKWGITVDPICALCQAHLESRDHLFVECTFARQLWSTLLTWLQRQPRFSKLSMLNVVMPSGERNKRIFEQKSRDWEPIAREVAYMCNARASYGLQSLLHIFFF
ncbi:uncharacterized protein LOC132048831 [Lycium ferocissimum]|uniref:uncharacterized protein LOC132048831 n=1 Tax=Lycium ferocissimum TaxID=112874 RepID=UPI002814C032|nr:uncharacterized protein LOC132048831 [Lycium ferocissimum]